MGFIGGEIGYRALKWYTRNGVWDAMDGSAYAGKSKVRVLLGDAIMESIEGKTSSTSAAAKEPKRSSWLRQARERLSALTCLLFAFRTQSAEREKPVLQIVCAFLQRQSHRLM